MQIYFTFRKKIEEQVHDPQNIPQFT